MKLFILIFLCIMCSCSSNINLGFSNLSDMKPTKASTENFQEIDVQFPISETEIFSHYRTINPSPIIRNNEMLFTTKNGRFFSLDLEKKYVRNKTNYSYGSNIPPIFNGTNFLLTSGLTKNSLQLYNSSTGEQLWKRNISYGVESKPVFDKNHLFVAAGNGLLYKLNRETGETVWAKQLRKPIRTGIIFYFDLLILSDDSGELYALDKHQGKEIWSLNIDKGASYTDPIILGDKLIYTTNKGYISQINPFTGKVHWERAMNAPIYSKPASDGKHIYVGTNDSHLYKLDMNGEEVWRFKTDANMSAQTLIGKKYLYFGASNGKFYIIDKTSREVKFTRNFKGRFIASPLFWKDNLIVFSDNDDVLMFSTKETVIAVKN